METYDLDKASNDLYIHKLEDTIPAIVTGWDRFQRLNVEDTVIINRNYYTIHSITRRDHAANWANEQDKINTFFRAELTRIAKPSNQNT